MNLLKKDELLEEINKNKLKSSLFSLMEDFFNDSIGDRFYIFNDDIILMNEMVKNFTLIENDFDNFYEKKNLCSKFKKEKRYIKLILLLWENKKLFTNDKLKHVEIFFNKHINSCSQICPEAYYKNMFETNKRILKDNTNLLDFINHLIINGRGINKDEYDIFKLLMNNVTEEDKLLISYINPHVLSHFINLLTGLVRNPLKEIKEDIKKDNFITTYKDFLKLIINYPTLFMKAYLFSAYLDIWLDKEILKFIKEKLNSNNYSIINERQTNSHTTQGKYLSKIIGKEFIFNDIRVNSENTNHYNPYCRPYFYGDSSPSNSIEKRLTVIESDFDNYISSFLTRKNQNINLKDKISFLICYVRTPNFIMQLYESFRPLYKVYCDNMWEEQQNISSIVERRNFLRQSFTNNELIKFNKIIQKKLLNIFLDYLEKIKKIGILDENESKSNIINEIKKLGKDSDLSIYYRCDQVKDFLGKICLKIHNILNNDYEIYLKDVDLKKFSNNFFIPRVCGQYTLFDNDNQIAFMYFPLTSKELIIFINKSIVLPEVVLNDIINNDCMYNNMESDEFIVQKI